MALLIGENPIALKEQSNHVVDRQAPTLKGTPPARVKREMDSTISSSIQPNPSGRIHNSIVSEQFTSALEEDSTRPTDSLYHNLITLSHRLEAQWGTAENGLTLNIDAPAGLATVEEYICDKEEINSVKIQAQGTIETLPAIGTIKVVHDGIETVHILDFITYNSTGLFNRSMQTMSARREDWSEVFENEEKEEDVELHHSLMLNCASVGFSIRDSSQKK
jgi:hypothetical protein